MPEQMSPEQPRWYATPQEVDVPVERIERGPFPEEVAVRVWLNGGSKTALVPTLAVNEARKTVKATATGEIGDYVLVALPPGSLGQTILKMSKQMLGELATPSG